MNPSSFVRALCIAACAFTLGSAWADPPGRVGRITYIEGAVSFYGDAEEGWRGAQVNYPVTTENSLWTEGNGRAEVRIGPSAIRVGEEAIFDFVKLQDDVALGFLQRGSVNVRLRQFGTLDTADTLQIETTEGRFTLEGNGRYRLDALAHSGESRMSVFSGRARFDSAINGETKLTIDAGKQLTVRISGSATDFRYEPARETAFDRWADGRDLQWDQTHQRYARDNTRETLISPYMTGYEDLDANGDWIDDGEYGRLWTPRMVAAGWAPYRYGRWTHVRPWGWTWIDDAPWGFAPFHYGRWVQVRSRWCWWPGPYIGRPVYAPALVAWLGSTGGGLTLSSGPAVGWFPLAPREYYIPRYTTNAQYVRRINHVTNNITIINPPTRYRNQVPGATIVSNQVFHNGHPVGTQTTHQPPHVIAGHTPIASPDAPRRPRNAGTQMPDRRQGDRAGTPAPQPRFATGAPPAQTPAQTRPAPGIQSPKYRAAEPGAGGPLPAPKNIPESTKGGPVVAPAAAVNPPTSQPKVRPQPASAPPMPSTATSPGVIRGDPAPVMPDRPARPDIRPETQPPSARSRSRPQPDLPIAPTAPVTPVTPIAAPVVAPRPPSTHPQPVVKVPAPTAVKPVPGLPTNPPAEARPEGSHGKNEARDGRGKPAVAKE